MLEIIVVIGLLVLAIFLLLAVISEVLNFLARIFRDAATDAYYEENMAFLREPWEDDRPTPEAT